MREVILSGALLALTSTAQFGCLEAQRAPAAQLHFEVASVKPAAPLSPGGVVGRALGMRGGPGTSAPGQINYGYVTLKQVLMAAYDVKYYQISGPAWLGGEHYDIVANVPPQTTREQLNQMLRNLLAERFNLTLHRETKELPVYELKLGKNGPTLKESVEDPDASGRLAGTPSPMPPSDKDGYPQLPAGRPAMIVMMPAGRMRVVARVQQLSQLINLIDLGRPMIDKTGLKAKYDFAVEFSTEGLNAPGPSAFATPPDDGAPSIFEAFEKQLGLKLEAKKDPIEMLVLDRVEKMPTDN